MQIVHKAKDNAVPAKGETVKPCENMKELDSWTHAEGICLNKCRSTVKLSLPQHNDTVGMKKKHYLATQSTFQHLFNITYHGCHVLAHATC